MELITDEKKLSLIRRYPLEMLIGFLFIWCGFITAEVVGLQEERKEYFNTDREKMLNVINENSKVIQQTNFLIQKQIEKNGNPDN